MATKKTKKTDNTMNQCFSLWRMKSKKGGYYFSGKIAESQEKIVAFYNTNKKNPKEPDIRVYASDNTEICICSMWCNVSERTGKKYMSGIIKPVEDAPEIRVVGFINEKATPKNKQPYLNVYYQEDKKEEVTHGRGQGEPKNYVPVENPIESDEDLPF